MTLSKTLMLGASLALFTGCESKETQPQGQPQGQPQPQASNSRIPPDFALPDVATGKTLRLSEYKGKVVLLDFWATWCGPCRMEIPHFVELQDTYKDKGFRMLGVSMDQQGEMVVKPFMKQWRVNYDMVIDSDGAVGSSYGGIRSIPTTLLIGRNGEVKEVFVGYRPKEVFEQAIVKALAES